MRITDIPDGYKLIFRPYITRNGRRIRRSDGKMWPLVVPIESDEKDQK